VIQKLLRSRLHRQFAHLVYPAAILLLLAGTAFGQAPKFRVIAIAEAGGIHKPFVDAAKIWLAREAAADGFSIDYIQDTDKIDDAFLAQYQLFIQLNYPPYAWKPAAVGSGFITPPSSANLMAIRSGPGSPTSWVASASPSTSLPSRPAKSTSKIPLTPS
jgi:hypothetical protein